MANAEKAAQKKLNQRTKLGKGYNSLIHSVVHYQHFQSTPRPIESPRNAKFPKDRTEKSSVGNVVVIISM